MTALLIGVCCLSAAVLVLSWRVNRLERIIRKGGYCAEDDTTKEEED